MHDGFDAVVGLGLLEKKEGVYSNHASAATYLLRSSPQNRLRVQHQRADELQRIMHRSMAAHLRAKRAHLRSLQSQLAALDPLSILQRGYAMATDVETGEVVSRVQQAEMGRRVRVRVSDGEFVTRVEER